MSKASEYAKRVAAAKDKPKEFYYRLNDYDLVRAYVTENGDLYISGRIQPEILPRFLDWLEDTFGENKT